MNELHTVLWGSETCQEMGTKQPSPHFPFFVPFQAHVKLTLNVGRTGCMYTDGIGRRLAVVEVTMMVVTVVHLETTAVVCASFV